MNKIGISGGFITYQNILNIKDIPASLVKLASKEGLQSLYVDPKALLEKYKDTPVLKEITNRSGEDLLWVKARSIDANVCNANGDYFSDDELTADVEYKDTKIPAYKTFEGCPIYTNHKNDDIELAKGMVVYAEWDNKNKCVWCTFFIDAKAYPDIARGIRMGYLHDVSMGTSVEYGICSKCNNKAHNESEYCKCLKEHKGRSKTIFEKNYGLKFIELSIVGDGAFEKCEIESIFDTDDILNNILSLEKTAKRIHNLAVIKCGSVNDNKNVIIEQEQLFRSVVSTANKVLKYAQSAGTLVGGTLMAQEGAGSNATIATILGALGIDSNAGLNILDLLNLALNLLEVGIMNLFARKDSIDLSHVTKITKAMLNLQATMQDMIDDGIDTNSGSNGTPLNTQQGMQQPQQNVPEQEYQNNESGVGRQMTPQVSQQPLQQQQATNYTQSPHSVGGGILKTSALYGKMRI